MVPLAVVNLLMVIELLQQVEVQLLLQLIVELVNQLILHNLLVLKQI